MGKEYLPIGSVCTLSRNNTKVMIMGYLSIEYDKVPRVYMYNAIPYPRGMSASGIKYSFNDSDIKSVDFVGFKSDEFFEQNRKLSKIDIEKMESVFDDIADDENKTIEKMMKFKFDENGVVVGVNDDKNNPASNNGSDAISNPFNSYKNDADNSKQQPNTEDSDKWDIFKRYKFDEKGTVVGIDEKPSEEVVNKTPAFKFDENGIVVSVGEEKLKEEIKKAPSFKFDEYGVVISTGNETPKEKNKTSGFKFDENGVVVAVEETVPARNSNEDRF